MSEKDACQGQLIIVAQRWVRRGGWQVECLAWKFEGDKGASLQTGFYDPNKGETPGSIELWWNRGHDAVLPWGLVHTMEDRLFRWAYEQHGHDFLAVMRQFHEDHRKAVEAICSAYGKPAPWEPGGK